MILLPDTRSGGASGRKDAAMAMADRVPAAGLRTAIAPTLENRVVGEGGRAPMKNLAGKTALLTGGNGGLGIHMARGRWRESMNLLLVAYPESGLEALRTAVEVACPRATVLVADLRQPTECARVVRHAEQLFGGRWSTTPPWNSLPPLPELSEDQVRDVLAVNLGAPMLIARLLLAGMVERRAGTSSISHP